MVRALVIQLGEVLSPVSARLARDHRARSGGSRLELLDAPVAAVGNLSRPVQVLREKLESDLVDALTRLLELDPSTPNDFVLDVYVLLNLGEPLVANATRVLIEMLERVVDQHFRTIFPAYRTGIARRFRILPIAMLPAAADCEKDRSGAIEELDSLHTFVREQSTDGRESQVDRLFLLDAMTGRGIAPIQDLVDQLQNFLRLAIFGGVRRDAEMVGLLESPRNDLFASIGIAAAEVDYEAVSQTLRHRLTRATAQTLSEVSDIELPSIEALLPVRVLDDAVALDNALAELEALPRRTLEADGIAALAPLVRAYDELLERVENWRETDNAIAAPRSSDVVAPLPRSRPALSGLLLAIMFGGAVAAAAHFIALASLSAVVASGGGFAVVTFVLTWLILHQSQAPDAGSSRSKRDEDEDHERRSAILDAVQHTVASRRTAVKALSARFEGISRAFDLGDDPEEAALEAGVFRDELTSPRLLERLFELHGDHAALAAASNDWLAAVGTWSAMLDGKADPEASSLSDFCAQRFAGIGRETLFADSDCRDSVTEQLRAFLQKWSQGVGVMVEGDSRKQFDPDGFYQPFSHTVLAPAALAPAVEAEMKGRGGPLCLYSTPTRLDDVFILSATADIHPDAVAAIALNEKSP